MMRVGDFHTYGNLGSRSSDREDTAKEEKRESCSSAMLNRGHRITLEYHRKS